MQFIINMCLWKSLFPLSSPFRIYFAHKYWTISLAECFIVNYCLFLAFLTTNIGSCNCFGLPSSSLLSPCGGNLLWAKTLWVPPPVQRGRLSSTAPLMGTQARTRVRTPIPFSHPSSPPHPPARRSVFPVSCRAPWVGWLCVCVCVCLNGEYECVTCLRVYASVCLCNSSQCVGAGVTLDSV